MTAGVLVGNKIRVGNGGGYLSVSRILEKLEKFKDHHPKYDGSEEDFSAPSSIYKY